MNTHTRTLAITVVGASQGTGAALVDQVLAAGHRVRSVSRRTPEADGHPNHRSVRGDANDPEVLRDAIAGADAVVVTVGAPADARTPVRTPVTTAVIEAMRNAGVRRLVVQSSLGVGDSIRRLDPVTRYVVFPFVLKRAMADHNAQEDLVRTSGLDWTILRPGYLNDQPANGRLIAILTDDRRRFSSKVSRQDVARYALDVVSDTSSIRKELLLVTPR